MSEIDDLVEGLWRRLRDVIMVAERVETFAFGATETGPATLRLDAAEAEALARDVVVRALRTAGDPLNWSILERAAASAEEGAALDEAAGALGIPRLVVSERVSELMQAGLAMRALDTDRVHATAAGLALVSLAGVAAAALAERVRKARGAEGNGLPVL